MSALETAVLYLRQGFAVVPVPHKSKRPVGDRWQNMRITEPLASRHFNGESQNIGALLGAPSAGLTDGDLDSQEAIIAAPYLMPRTGAVFGRASKRFSHRLYKTTLAESQGKAAIQFKDTQKPPKVILELRIGANASGEHAAQTIFPGSVHPSGELIAWDEHGEPSVADDAMLLAAAARVAACVLLARAYPQQGGRHEGALIVAGFLARCGFTLADTKLFVEALAAVTMQRRTNGGI
jgi:Bifunctional DNA primase/polymerase, N-terminal